MRYVKIAMDSEVSFPRTKFKFFWLKDLVLPNDALFYLLFFSAVNISVNSMCHKGKTDVPAIIFCLQKSLKQKSKIQRQKIQDSNFEGNWCFIVLPSYDPFFLLCKLRLTNLLAKFTPNLNREVPIGPGWQGSSRSAGHSAPYLLSQRNGIKSLTMQPNPLLHSNYLIFSPLLPFQHHKG